MLATGVAFLRGRTRGAARRVFLMSLVYLPAQMVLFLVDRPVAQIWMS